ncbi:MAG: hypothetical protein FWE23_09710 [Chitinivibrionia bacterium]|nr:hypothetical protein [Chitinivibrionia bacterium]
MTKRLLGILVLAGLFLFGCSGGGSGGGEQNDINSAIEGIWKHIWENGSEYVLFAKNGNGKRIFILNDGFIDEQHTFHFTVNGNIICQYWHQDWEGERHCFTPQFSGNSVKIFNAWYSKVEYFPN